MKNPYPLPDLSDLVSCLDRGDSDFAIGGVVPGARSLALAALVRSGWPRNQVLSARVLVVVPHIGDASEVKAGLELLAPGIGVGIVPAETSAAYQGAEPPLAARMELVDFLERIALDEVQLIIAPVRALLMPIPDPSDVLKQTIKLQTGDEVDTQELADNMVRCGFSRVDLVEEVGDFAIRGWVIDIHPGGSCAFRLEMDDDLIEAIRPFDPVSQRGAGDVVEHVEISSLAPFPASEERLFLLSEELQEGFPSLAGEIRDNTERRLWWSAMHLAGGATTWLDLVSSYVVCDRDEVMGELGRWHSVQARDWHTLSERSCALPGPEIVLVDPDRVRDVLENAALRLEELELHGGDTRWWRIGAGKIDSFVRRIPDLVPTLRSRRAQDMVQVLAVASEGEERRFAHLLKEGDVVPQAAPPPPGGISIVLSSVQHGFIWDGGLVVYGRNNLTASPPPRPRRSGVSAFRSDLRDLKPGDLVVHIDHGIGQFSGFRRVDVEGSVHEMMALEYQGGDSLLVPVERADLIQKYSASEGGGTPKLDRLGGGTWQRRKARVKKAVREMAAELLRLAAVRHAASGYSFAPDSPWQREFEDAFEWDLTIDQQRAVDDIKADMECERPMDRLLCGDVGYGKTEVAIRAAFKTVMDGKQVAVLAPTTILAGQHLRTFVNRFSSFPVETGLLSRFVSSAEVKKTLVGVADGRVDILIGTHRILSQDVRFCDLGLVIVDEEQRFGVAQKEKLKLLRTECDVLSMSATPIPRTLNMAMSGLRDISLIETPPRDRQAVETQVLEFSEDVVREAVLYEIERGGQVFFVHNRVRSIGAIAEWLHRVVPEARIVVAHGQLNERHLEKAMRAFLDREADVLLATAIVENGLDIPNANTLLVNRADRFGLAQLYQLRGRVGRSDRLAFANFLVPVGKALTEQARARLSAIQEFCQLGAGFRIAARDLEIRGAGNMLGGEQHGFMEAVGFETYCELLEEAVAELEGKPIPRRREVELRLGLDVQLPDAYIPEPALRLSFYKRLAASHDEVALNDLVTEVVDRYGPVPEQLTNLVAGQRLRIAAMSSGVSAINKRGGQWRLRLDVEQGLPSGLTQALARWPDARVTPGGEIVFPPAKGIGIDDVRNALEVMAG